MWRTTVIGFLVGDQRRDSKKKNHYQKERKKNKARRKIAQKKKRRIKHGVGIGGTSHGRPKKKHCIKTTISSPFPYHICIHNTSFTP